MNTRYEALYRHSKREYEQISSVMAEVTGQLEAARQQLESLQAYVQTLSQPRTSTEAHHKLVQQRHFVHQVFNAIEHQTRQVHELQQQLEQVREKWLEKRAQLKGLEKRMEKARLDQQKRADKRSQQALDERSAWAFADRKKEDI